MLWITSDHHFSHQRICEYAHRDFASVAEMDQHLIDAWNACIKKGDTVYHLGDVTIGTKPPFYALNGSIVVLANREHHDRRWLEPYNIFPSYFKSVSATGELVVLELPLLTLYLPQYGIGKHKRSLMLSHFPLAEWNAKHHGGWHCHGHSHSRGDQWRTDAALDVGVDNAFALLGEYRPFSIDEVAAILQERNA